MYNRNRKPNAVPSRIALRYRIVKFVVLIPKSAVPRPNKIKPTTATRFLPMESMKKPPSNANSPLQTRLNKRDVCHVRTAYALASRCNQIVYQRKHYPGRKIQKERILAYNFLILWSTFFCCYRRGNIS